MFQCTVAGVLANRFSRGKQGRPTFFRITWAERMPKGASWILPAHRVKLGLQIIPWGIIPVVQNLICPSFPLRWKTIPESLRRNSSSRGCGGFDALCLYFKSGHLGYCLIGVGSRRWWLDVGYGLGQWVVPRESSGWKVCWDVFSGFSRFGWRM